MQVPRGIVYGTRRAAIVAQVRDHCPPGMAAAYEAARAQALGARVVGVSPMRQDVTVTAVQTQGTSSGLRQDPFLVPGSTNRLFLSLRSGIGSQVDWALRNLASYTFQMADKFLVAEYPGLCDALAEFVRRLCFAAHGLPRRRWDLMQADIHVNGMLVDQGYGLDDEYAGIAATSVALARRKATPPIPPDAPFQPAVYARDAALLRRAAEATLILRNLSLSSANVASLAQVPMVLDVIHQGLALEDVHECHDLRVNMLEVLECLAPHLVLSDWARQRFVLHHTQEAARFVEDEIFARLYDMAHHSPDRALLLGSLRCLRAFASNTANAPVLAEVDSSLQPTHLHLMTRCLALLPLTQDPELLEAALDLLYQLVMVGDNALLLGVLTSLDKRAYDPSGHEASPTHAIVGFLARNLALGKSVWERDTDLTVNQGAWWAPHVPSVTRTRQRRELERREKMTPAERARYKQLPPDVQARLERLGEPERGMEWMKTLFEYDPQGEVTQMEFWITYRDQFTPTANRGGAPLQPAANLIRNVSQAFPGAAALVIPGAPGAQPRFVIRGIVPRIRATPGPVCPWLGCPSPQAPSWAAVREHLETHVSLSNEGVCRCLGCTFVALSGDEAIQRAQLLQHVLTHLPMAEEPGVPRAPSASKASGTQDHPGVLAFDVERTPSVPTLVAGQPPSPCGVAYLSLLVLRYMTRASQAILQREGFGCPAYTYGGAVPAARTPAERDEQFGFPMAALADDAQTQTEVSPDFEARSAHAAVRIMEAVASVEDVLVETSLRNDILCRFVNDTLVAIRPVDV